MLGVRGSFGFSRSVAANRRLGICRCWLFGAVGLFDVFRGRFGNLPKCRHPIADCECGAFMNTRPLVGPGLVLPWESSAGAKPRGEPTTSGPKGPVPGLVQHGHPGTVSADVDFHTFQRTMRGLMLPTAESRFIARAKFYRNARPDASKRPRSVVKLSTRRPGRIICFTKLSWPTKRIILSAPVSSKR